MAQGGVVIVGAGLAGLSCALQLQARGVPFQIIEASDGVGGRVRTDDVEGCLLDRGFQVYLTAYPEGKRILDYAALDLKPFRSGAVIRMSGKFKRISDPWRDPGQMLPSLFSRALSLGDKLRLAALRKRLMATTEDQILAAENQTAEGLLKNQGFSTRMIDRFFRPFMGGIMLDSSLMPSSRMFEFVFKMMSAGDAAVPSRGIGEIPKQMAARLPVGSIRLGERVSAVDSKGVTLETGEVVLCDAVVLACDGNEAAALAPEHIAPMRWRGVTCLYYEAPEPPIKGPWLVLNGNNRWPINNVAVMSEVSPSYAPVEKALVSVSVLGQPTQTDEELQLAVSAQLERWFGKSSRSWKLLRTYRIENAQPEITPGPMGDSSPKLTDTLYAAGDHRAMPTIHSAMLSGHAAAEAVAAS